MKVLFKAVASLLMPLIAASAAAQSANKEPEACWLETSASTMDAAVGSAEMQNTMVWGSTISGVLIRHPRVMCSSTLNLAPNAEAQMNELLRSYLRVADRLWCQGSQLNPR